MASRWKCSLELSVPSFTFYPVRVADGALQLSYPICSLKQGQNSDLKCQVLLCAPWNL